MYIILCNIFFSTVNCKRLYWITWGLKTPKFMNRPLDTLDYKYRVKIMKNVKSLIFISDQPVFCGWLVARHLRHEQPRTVSKGSS